MGVETVPEWDDNITDIHYRRYRRRYLRDKRKREKLERRLRKRVYRYPQGITYLKGTFNRDSFGAGFDLASDENSHRITFNKLSVNGDKIHPNPYSYAYEKLTYTHGTVTYMGQYPYRDSGVLGDYGILGMPPDAFTKSEKFRHQIVAEDKALGKWLNSIRGKDPFKQIGHDSLVDFFESPELRHLNLQIREIIKLIKRKKLLLAIRRNPAALAAEYWLLWQFGLKPLIQSLHELKETLKKGGFFDSEKFRFVGQSKETKTLLLPFDGGGEFESLVQYSHRTIYGGFATLTDIDGAIASQFGLDVPLSSFYQSVSLTFVLDWFINISAFLAKIEFIFNFQRNPFYYLDRMYKTTVIQQMAINTKVGAEQRSLFEAPYDYNIQSVYRSVSMNRTLISELPTPHLPRIDVRLNAAKIASLAALAKQRMF